MKCDNVHLMQQSDFTSLQRSIFTGSAVALNLIVWTKISKFEYILQDVLTVRILINECQIG